MLHSLIAWDADGNVVATLDYLTAKDDSGDVVGLVDFGAHESNGGRLREVWEHSAAVGSGTWPEWLKGAAHDFRVEIHDSPAPARAKIKALVHKKSGHRRERAAIEAEIESRTQKAHAEHRKHNGADADVSKVPVDLRDLLGGPDRPLLLDDDGKTKARPKVTRPNLPVVGRL